MEEGSSLIIHFTAVVHLIIHFTAVVHLIIHFMAMCRDMNIEYVILIGAGIVAVGNLSGRIESGRSNSGGMIRIRLKLIHSNS